MILVSILIANYNNGEYFKECYDSIIAQTYSNWEAIIVDDCSTDDSMNAIRGLIGNDQRFRIFENSENKGCGYTKNRCAAIADGEIAGFLDPDDALTPDAIQKMADKHIEFPEVSLVHSKLYFCDSNLKPERVFETAKQITVSDNFTNLEAIVTAFATFKMAIYRKTGGINPLFLRAVDQDLYLKLAEHGPFKFIDQALYYYRLHAKGIAIGNPHKAFFWYLKALRDAEIRRGVNFEVEVTEYMSHLNEEAIEVRVRNPRYLLLKLLASFRHSPSAFFKKLFLNK